MSSDPPSLEGEGRPAWVCPRCGYTVSAQDDSPDEVVDCPKYACEWEAEDAPIRMEWRP